MLKPACPVEGVNKASVTPFSLVFTRQLGFGKNWNLTSSSRARSCASQETRNFEQGKMQDGQISTGSAMSVTSEKILYANSETAQRSSLPPLVSALKASAEQNAATFHFPGHNRGQAAPPSLSQLIGLAPFIHDTSSLPELDNLFLPKGPILEAQKQAAKLFGSSETWFLVGGTTCGIQAAVMATCSPGDYLILPRNAHMSAFSGMVLSGCIPKYINPEYDYDWDIPGGITPSQVEKAIKELEMDGQRAAAVFVTSPTYHGICSNLSEISKLCHSSGIPLIVDEAHGAHLGFQPPLPKSALQQGADLVAQSTHKVLCSLSQSSMLHLSGNMVDRERICRCLRTLQSTSPSYLLLASLDAARAQISENPEITFNRVIDLAIEVKNLVKEIPGISVLDFPSFSSFPAIDPFRLTTGFWQLGLSGYEADEFLHRDEKIICELVGNRTTTYVFNLGTCREHILRLITGMKHLSATSASVQKVEEKAGRCYLAPFADINMCLSPRDAFFASRQNVSIAESLGKVCGELICPFPPGIPLLFPGEIITESALDYLLHVRSMGVVITGASDPQLSSIVVCDV